MSPCRHPGPPLQEPCLEAGAADVCPDTVVPTETSNPRPAGAHGVPSTGCHTWQALQSPTWLHADGTSVGITSEASTGSLQAQPSSKPPAWAMELSVPERRFMSSECCPAAWCLSSSPRHQLHPDALLVALHISSQSAASARAGTGPPLPSLPAPLPGHELAPSPFPSPHRWPCSGENECFSRSRLINII